jgi:cobalamin biosynthesis Mg chelatase CobN
VRNSDELSVTEFLKQANAYDIASRSRLGRLLRDSQSLELTHPLPVVRAQELDKWAKSAQYLGLIRRAKALKTMQKSDAPSSTASSTSSSSSAVNSSGSGAAAAAAAAATAAAQSAVSSSTTSGSGAADSVNSAKKGPPMWRSQ